MKICHVITRMIVGGAQENTLLSVIGQLERGHEVVLLTGPSPGSEGELLKRADFPEFRIVEMPSLVREINPLQDWKACRELKRFFREEKFDVVHTHSSKAGIVGRFAASAAHVPAVVHTVHGQAFHSYEKWWKNQLYIRSEKLAAAKSDRIFAVAQAMIDQCVEAGIAPRDRYRVVYSGMEIDRFLNAVPDDALRQKLGIPANVPVIATLARLFELKGYEFAIPCAIELSKRYPDVHYLIIGDGPMKEELERETAKAGLRGRFHFAGLVSPNCVHEYLALCDILWHLSLREGLPRSVVQALACGKPAVGFALDGTPEVITDGHTGFLARPESCVDVLEKTVKLLENPGLRKQMGEAGREKVKEQFAWRKMADILLEEYERVLERKN